MERSNGKRAGLPMLGRRERRLRYEEGRLARVEAQITVLAGRAQTARKDALDAAEAYRADPMPENAAYLQAIATVEQAARVQLWAARQRREELAAGIEQLRGSGHHDRAVARPKRN